MVKLGKACNSCKRDLFRCDGSVGRITSYAIVQHATVSKVWRMLHRGVPWGSAPCFSLHLLSPALLLDFLAPARFSVFGFRFSVFSKCKCRVPSTVIWLPAPLSRASVG